jgi:HK97 family phage major capsid protein
MSTKTTTRPTPAALRASWDEAEKLPAPKRADHRRAVLVEARTARDEAFNAHGAILTAAQSQNRSLLASEQRSLDALENEMRGLGDVHSELLELGSVVDRSAVVVPGQRGSSDSSEYRQGLPLLPGQTITGYVRSRGGWAREDGGEERADFSRFIRSMVSGDGDEQRAMSVGVAADGGITVPAPLSAQIIDLARNEAKLLRAGVRVVPMESDTLKVPKVTGEPTTAWHSESALIPESGMTFDSIQLKAKTLTSRVKMTMELLEDSPTAADALQRAFVEQVALSIDLAGLYGSGVAPEPRGLFNVAGIEKTDLGANGAQVSWDTYLAVLGELWGRNHAPSGLIHAPRTELALAGLKDANLQYLSAPPVLADMPRHASNQIPTNKTHGTAVNASDAFAGDFSELYFGIRTSFRVKVLNERYADTGEIGFLVWLRGDFVVAREGAFQIVTGIIP